MSLFMLGVNKKVKETNKLAILLKLIDWKKCKNYLKNVHKNDIDPQGGQKAYDNLKMFKTLLLQQWHNLSDEQTEEALCVRIDFMMFTGFELNDDIPDSCTIGRFRNKLIQKNLDKKLFKEINRQLEKLGLKLEKANGAVIDATIIESASRPRKTVNIEQDREENNTKIEVEESKDPDARWLKKGKRCYFGYKGFAIVDTEGFYDKIHTESANEAEIDKLEKVMPGVKAKRLLGDKGYASAKNRKLLKENKIKDGIMHKAQKNKELTPRQKLINKLISKQRYIVEQGFGTLKRKFKFERASYTTKRKVQAQFTFKAICSNLLKAVNKIVSGRFVPIYA
jgi:IS5 family transposase